MNSIRWIIASTIVGLLAAGCADPNPSPDDEEALGETQQALPSSFTLTTYYQEAAKIHQVGYCTSPSTCSGFTTVCSGIKTAYKTLETIVCD